MEKTKKIPERQCIGCGEIRPKKEMFRVVRSPEGELSIDFTGKKSGRGAYLCPDEKCLKKAIKSKKLGRSLNCEVPEELYDILANEIAFEKRRAGDDNE